MAAVATVGGSRRTDGASGLAAMAAEACTGSGPRWAWSGLVADSRGWVLDEGEPAARWALLVGVLDRSHDDVDVLAVWRNRGSHKPSMFGHGRTFKTVKWPPTWYRVDALLDAVGAYPQL